MYRIKLFNVGFSVLFIFVFLRDNAHCNTYYVSSIFRKINDIYSFRSFNPADGDSKVYVLGDPLYMKPSGQPTRAPSRQPSGQVKLFYQAQI